MHAYMYRCFIPSLPVSLIAVGLPVVLCMLVVIAVLSHSCVYWSRWEDYHNIYHDSFNRREIPLLLTLFALIFFTGLAGYLHVYVAVVYTYSFFVALNVIQVSQYTIEAFVCGQLCLTIEFDCAHSIASC